EERYAWLLGEGAGVGHGRRTDGMERRVLPERCFRDFGKRRRRHGLLWLVEYRCVAVQQLRRDFRGGRLGELLAARSRPRAFRLASALVVHEHPPGALQFLDLYAHAMPPFLSEGSHHEVHGGHATSGVCGHAPPRSRITESTIPSTSACPTWRY